MPMSPRLLRPRASGLVLPTDADARAYVIAVNTADGQPLEAPVVQAIDAFVIGCKSDGIWSAIKASCLLMGARTLSGALTPLVGSAPTNDGFVSGDYNRKTGLLGDGVAKSINTNRLANADPQDSHHVSVYASTTEVNGFVMIGAGGGADTGIGVTQIGAAAGAGVGFRNRHTTNYLFALNNAGFFGTSRSSSSEFAYRASGQGGTVSQTSDASVSRAVRVFARETNAGAVGAYSSARIAFYSVGEAVTLSLLDSRVTALYNAIVAAIP